MVRRKPENIPVTREQHPPAPRCPVGDTDVTQETSAPRRFTDGGQRQAESIRPASSSLCWSPSVPTWRWPRACRREAEPLSCRASVSWTRGAAEAAPLGSAAGCSPAPSSSSSSTGKKGASV